MARKRQEEFERQNRHNRLLKEQLAQKTHHSRSLHTSKVRYDAEKTKELIQVRKSEILRL